MRRGADLIVGGELILSGNVLMDEYAAWMWEEDFYFTPSMVRDAMIEAGPGRVTVRITSNGGHVHAGESIRSMLASHPGGARIVVEGIAASAATLILMGGAERVISAGSFLMIHEPAGGAWGGYDDLRREADVLESLTGVYAGIYAAVSGQSVTEMRRIMAEEIYFSASEAMERGFVTSILDDETAAAAPAAVAAMQLRSGSLEAARAAVLMARSQFETRLQSRSAHGASRPARVPAADGGSPARMATTMESVMDPEDQAVIPAPPTPTPAPAAPVMHAPSPDAAVVAERDRVARIMTLAQPYVEAGRLAQADVTVMVAEGVSAEGAAARFMAQMAAAEPPVSRSPAAWITRDETQTRMQAMEDALYAGLTRSAPSEMARPYAGHSLVEMAAARMGVSRVPSGFGAREQVLMSAFHSTSDFPALFESALNRSLAARYASALPTYRAIARQRKYADFREHTTVRAGDFPNLKPVNPDGGELESSTFSEAKERTSVKAYGVQVALSRAMLVNDTLDGIAQVLSDRGMAVARFEDQTFYAMMLGGANADGPSLLETTRQVFNTTDVSKAGTNAVINKTSLSVGRAAMRKRTSLDGAKLSVVASILLVGPDKETEAEEMVAAVQPQQSSNVNPFSGRLTPVVTAEISGNAWYLFADPSEVPCFEWGLLDGYTAPRFRIEDVFGRQGTMLSLEHDFGCGAIDFRGGFKNAGA